ncbi:hypothetical protein JOD63_000368 [Microbacterium terrae]|uniref:Type VII secretion system protein EccE domain-containing protein n=1 Tax=Microbacterium terrae TaxID=69369 RepID=A0A0M2H292_9MICO|nr:SCO6880 family protein [Microbacterium terrae]KJL37569.1 hypothetical protein RS81_03326 [Microbacterium terrae]MBP1076400.1 hypothetical protein [Microbacterium terrae]GLJ97226.1 hypothetical protein GCM10017594_04230 [Microbacterium terrae]
MTTRTSPAEYALAPMRFSRLSRRGILLGLSLPQLIAVALALVTVVVALYSAGGSGVAWTAPLWGSSMATGFIRISGRTIVEWMPIVMRWARRASTGQLEYRKRIERPRPVGTLALPGDAASAREWEDAETGAAMIHDPHARTLTAVVEVTHPAFTLLDPAEQQRRVNGWGRALAATCRSGRVARVQVSERTLPDAGTGLADWWGQRGTDDGGWAATTYRDLIESAGPAGARHTTTISLSVDLAASARQVRTNGGGIQGAAGVLRQEMSMLVSALRAADITVGHWLGADELAGVLRTAYDPAAATRLERHPAVGRSLADAGPIAITERWDCLRSDSGFHAVLWISEWPRSQVFPGFLGPLILSDGILRTVSLHYVPVATDRAARDLRRKKTELVSDAHQRSRMGQVENAASTAEYADIMQQESELTAGHGMLRTIGLISVTARTRDELESAVAAVEQAAVQASCETRRLVGQQSQAFTAAALPLCRSV